MTADLAIINASMRTMDPTSPTADALAVANGFVVAVGSTPDVEKLCDTNTRVVDAKGATVLPGIIESHMHIFSGAFSRTVLSLSNVTGTAEVAAAIRDYAANTPGEPLLLAQGVVYGCLDGDRDPTRHDLDAICPDRPLLLQSADFHNGWANTAALEAAGALYGLDVGAGSEIALDENSVATGVLTEPPAVATILALGRHGGRENLGIKAVEPDETLTNEQRSADRALLRDGLDYCAAQGITTIINMDGNLYQADLLAEIEADGDLVCRVELPYHFTPDQRLENVSIAEQMRDKLNSDKLWCGRVKLFMDGVLDMETAYRIHDYPGRPGYKGKPLHSSQAFNEIATEFDKRGFQISVHAIGDGAVRTVLDGYEAARNANGTRDSRHRVEHVELIDPNDLTRMAELGVVASVQPPHPPGCEFPLEPTVSVIGTAEWPNAYRWKSMKEAGVRVCFSSDWPVANLSPLSGIGFATSRQPWDSDQKDERITFDETLAAYTAEGAYAAFKEDQLGRLSAGYRADIVVFDRELTERNSDEAQVAMTICDGTVTFESAVKRETP